MEEQYGKNNAGCCLTIEVSQPINNGLVQMYARFNFIATRGIMRFVNPNSGDDDDEKSNDENEDEGEEEDEAEDEVENEDEGDDDEDEFDHMPQFWLSKAMLPSSNNRTLYFRWRGEDPGEGEIDLGSDSELCSITFESPSALKGGFISPSDATTEFRGIKRSSMISCRSLDPNFEWSKRSKAAHERQRWSRWH